MHYMIPKNVGSSMTGSDIGTQVNRGLYNQPTRSNSNLLLFLMIVMGCIFLIYILNGGNNKSNTQSDIIFNNGQVMLKCEIIQNQV